MNSIYSPLNRVKLGRTVTFMKYLASVVTLIFPPVTLIWNNITLPPLYLLNLAWLVVNELTKSISKEISQYSFFFPIYHCILQILQELITKEQDNFSKILISIVLYQPWATSPRAFGVRGVEMKIFERIKKQKFPLKFKWFFYRLLISKEWASKLYL